MGSKNRIIWPIIIFLLMMSLFALTSTLEYERTYQRCIEETQDELMDIKNNLEYTITSRILAINGLKAYVEIHPDFNNEEFDYFAKGIYESANDVVRGMFFLKDTTLTHAYPYQANKDAIGTDLSLSEEQKDWVNYTKENNKSIITAPVNLIEGGTGIIVRVPVMRQGSYFGQVSIVFDYDKTMYTIGLLELANDNYIELKKTNEPTKNEKVVWTNFDTKKIVKADKKVVSIKVNLYETEMVLKAIPKNGFRGKSVLFYLIIGIGGIIATVSSLLVYKLVTITLIQKENNNELEALINQLRVNEEELYIQYDKIKKQKEYINFLADCDYLTTLYNRRRFAEDMKQFINKDKLGTILLLDIDNFKNINDIQGHFYGDKVLKHIALVLKESLGEDAVAYRIGGDEFTVHLPSITDHRIIESFINSFFKALKVDNYVDNIKHHITASVGIAKYPLDANTADDLIKKSDIAMYQAKKDGKNRYCYFTEDLSSNFGYNIDIEKELQNALDNYKFKMAYQPIINTKNGEIASLEALIRIEDSLLSPADFIPVAENSGLIVPIGMWVIDEVCRQLSEWQEKGTSIMPIAVNVSAKQLYDGNLFKHVKQALHKYNLSPQLLEIEITESVLIKNSAYMIKRLQKFRELGMKISLDDFGTGYSSISYLTYMPIDKVKIDKSLKDEFLFLENSAVMQGIISICHGLKMIVVTEGVETKAEFERLREFGSDFIQGYYFEKPISGEEMEKRLNKNYSRCYSDNIL